jgi:ubiquinone/menaquinone biosynthesis C-methylase UbiE
MTQVLPENEEAQRAWDGVLFDRFVRFRHLIVALAQHGEVAMRRFPPPDGARVVDIGCGFGDSAVQLAELAGPSGSVLGVDISPRFVEASRADAKEARAGNVRFAVMDVQAASFDERFDYAFSRFGGRTTSGCTWPSRS